jgi:hypothetical protein
MKDAIGNPLKEGQLVHATFEIPLKGFNGFIVSIQAGGISRIGGSHKGPDQTLTPCVIKVKFECEFEFDPRLERAGSLLCLVDPRPVLPVTEGEA